MTPTTDPRPELYWTLFVLVQHLSRRMDERLAPLELTSRQWLLLAVLQRFFPASSPTLTEAAARYGTSRQNVKQIAAGLERRGWLRIEPDRTDARASRLVLTDRIDVFASPALIREGAEFLHAVFADAPEEELGRLRNFTLHLLARLDVEAGTPPGGVR
jgi:DNA-binding MarR family transcriptional regulator